MVLFITCDADWDSKVDKFVDLIEDYHYAEHFEMMNYGDGVREVTVVLMCHNFDVGMSPRKKYSTVKHELSFDVFLDYKQMINLADKERHTVIVNGMIDQLIHVSAEKKIKKFDSAAFSKDLRDFFVRNELIQNHLN